MVRYSMADINSMRYLIILIITVLSAAVRADLSVPAMNSRPGATSTIYLDFHGEAAGVTWGNVVHPAPAFDQDGDPTSFSAQEQISIQTIFDVVAQAYSPFNVNITTVDPGGWTAKTLHQARECIGGDSGWTGQQYGGISYIGSMTINFVNDSHTGFVFPLMLGNVTDYVADAVVHEAGHAAGLQHQSVWQNGVLVNEYAPGVWMGNAYGWPNPIWTTGLNDSGITQNDVQILTLNLGAAVPEPQIWVMLMAVGMATLLIRRTRSS